MSKQSSHVHTKLSELYATAICGNDILSSSLYVSGIAVLFAGVYAPIVLAIIALILFFYKSVYTEVVEALPINGGAYNCLLNGTSKTIAAIAGVTTILSYVATAVISAKVGVEYVHTVLPIPVIPVTIGLLLVFAILVISGIKDSAKVAAAIFIFHILTLISFLGLGLVYWIKGNPSLLADNLHHTTDLFKSTGGIGKALFFGFAASLLGVSGFESSANFVEEQEKGVFRKTLRNMLIGIAIFNPLIALVALNIAPIEVIAQAKDFLLADMAHILGGHIFQYIVVFDAFFVLAGAVLTSYVGVSGLAYRMASDACLPDGLARINKKGSYPRVIVAFFLLCTSILLATKGNTLSLAGVYTISFLGVMTLFAFGNLILRETRTELKRTYSAPLIFVVLAMLATIIGIFGNIRIDRGNLIYFEFYFIPALIIVLSVVYQDYIIKFLIRVTKSIGFLNSLHNYLVSQFKDMTGGEFVAFIHHPSRIHQILDYINRNETGWNITLIHCPDEDGKNFKKEIESLIEPLQKAGVFPYFNIKVVYKDETFSPELVDKVSKEMGVRKNRILIGSIHEEHPYDYADFQGVRIIF